MVIAPGESVDTSSSHATPRLPVIRLALWFGLVAGLLEMVLLVLRVKLLENGVFLRSPHFPWMIPAADLGLFLALGLLMVPIARTWPRVGGGLALGGFIFLACLCQLLLIRGLWTIASVVLAAGFARFLAMDLLRRRESFLRGVKSTLPVLALILVAIVAVCFARESPAFRGGTTSQASVEESRDRPNVLLVVLDTVRADRLTPYGYHRDTTPQLAKLAKRGVRFDRVHSSAPWTLPSHATMFTGRWPHEMKIETVGSLDTTYPTLAEFLGSHGYATAGVVANQFFCGHETGLNRGFATYRDYPLTPGEVLRSTSVGWLLSKKFTRVQDEFASRFLGKKGTVFSQHHDRKPAGEVNREFLEWLGGVKDQPFFAFLNFFDTHSPYFPPPDWTKHFGAVPKSQAEADLVRDWWMYRTNPHRAEEIGLMVDLYDDCLAAQDEQIGLLFDHLEKTGVLDKTLVIITSDHGEEFGEHGQFIHGYSLYESATRVPLFIFAPRDVPKDHVVKESVSLRDIPATVIDLLGLEGDSTFPGASLARTWKTSGETKREDPAISELRTLIEPTREAPVGHNVTDQATALYLDKYSYLKREDGREELYDLDADPAQNHDLAASPDSAATLNRFRDALDAIPDAKPDAGRPKKPR